MAWCCIICRPVVVTTESGQGHFPSLQTAQATLAQPQGIAGGTILADILLLPRLLKHLLAPAGKHLPLLMKGNLLSISLYFPVALPPLPVTVKGSPLY